ncbi:hypothetical protein [Sulfurimonas sp.]|uniref:hypothetical protein n=1 Tax=Sulfurimonas sp. TaxID=2022749 RepID=UPI0019DB2CC8|nr:hypothetical protein [Sulfurimonas sp.]MBE0513863.1 hypothetical protein [Sulfurimonas sp.]MDT8339434.1 hypothetical protein [Sulfurimonas sp.]
MLEIFKRYSLAIFFLLLISGLMVLATIGVKHFSDGMVKDAGIVVKPREERLVK